jgi:hypothetical protein
MIRPLVFLFFSIVSFAGVAYADSPAFTGKLVAKLNAYVGECGAPGADPKPKMAEFVKYLQTNGFKDAKVECSLSHFEGTTPVILIHGADGAEYFVNFRYAKGRSKPKVSDAMVDEPSPAGPKRHSLWPVAKTTK